MVENHNVKSNSLKQSVSIGRIEESTINKTEKQKKFAHLWVATALLGTIPFTATSAGTVYLEHRITSKEALVVIVPVHCIHT